MRLVGIVVLNLGDSTRRFLGVGLLVLRRDGVDFFVGVLGLGRSLIPAPGVSSVGEVGIEEGAFLLSCILMGGTLLGRSWLGGISSREEGRLGVGTPAGGDDDEGGAVDDGCGCCPFTPGVVFLSGVISLVAHSRMDSWNLAL